MQPPSPANSIQRAPGGFTLLEIMLALAIFGVVVTGVFAIAQGTMELSVSMKEAQEAGMIRQNFIEFLRSSFRRLPADAEMQLEVKADGGQYVPTLTIYNGGDAFSPGATMPPDASVELFGRTLPGGYMRIGLRMLDGEQTNGRRINANFRPSRSGTDFVLPLIESAARFEWKLFDAASGRWEKAWKGPGRPSMAECIMKLDDGVETRCVFWIPPLAKNTGTGIPAGGVPQLGPDGKPLPPDAQGVPPAVNPNVNPVPQLNPTLGTPAGM
ncbi:MAG: type II secretion system protein [Verrucomicrobiaceae bacterium]|nr:type II secretion system protein [Verrucomicrobiaceae bacterium]